MLTRPARVLLLTSMLPPYRIPLFNELGEAFGQGFSLVLMARSSKHRHWDVDPGLLRPRLTILRAWHLPKLWFRTRAYVNFGIFRHLVREAPDVIVAGGFPLPSAWAALVYCKLRRRPLVHWGGNLLVDEARPMRLALHRFYLKQADASVAYSTRGAEAMIRHGVESSTIFVGPNVGDTERFAAAARRGEAVRDTARTSEKLSGVVLLYSGRVMREKGIPEFIDALAALRRRDWTLLVLGDGPYQAECERLVARRGLAAHVQFRGFLQAQELPRLYALADLFVFPTLGDLGSIALGEALASGLYALVSVHDNVAPDLIRQGENGVFFNPNSPAEFSATLDSAIQAVVEKRVDRDAVRAAMDAYSPRRYAGAFVAAVTAAAKQRTEA